MSITATAATTALFSALGPSVPIAPIIYSRFGSYTLDMYDLQPRPPDRGPVQPQTRDFGALRRPVQPQNRDFGALRRPVQPQTPDFGALHKPVISKVPACDFGALHTPVQLPPSDVTAIPPQSTFRDFGGLSEAVEQDRMESYKLQLGSNLCRVWLGDPEAAAVPAGPSAAELKEQAYSKLLEERQQEAEAHKISLGLNFAKYNQAERTMNHFRSAIASAGSNIPREQFTALKEWLSNKRIKSLDFIALERQFDKLCADWTDVIATAQELYDVHHHFLNLDDSRSPQQQESTFSPLAMRASLLNRNLVQVVNKVLLEHLTPAAPLAEGGGSEERAALSQEQRKHLQILARDAESMNTTIQKLLKDYEFTPWSKGETSQVATLALTVIELLDSFPLTKKNREFLGQLKCSAESLLDPYNTYMPLHERLGVFLTKGVKQQGEVLKRFEELGSIKILQHIHEVKHKIKEAAQVPAPLVEENVEAALAKMANVHEVTKRKQRVNAHRNEQAAGGGGGGGGGGGVNPRLDPRDKERAMRQGAAF